MHGLDRRHSLKRSRALDDETHFLTYYQVRRLTVGGGGRRGEARGGYDFRVSQGTAVPFYYCYLVHERLAEIPSREHATGLFGHEARFAFRVFLKNKEIYCVHAKI